MNSSLEIEFQNAFDNLSMSKEALPPDIMLKLYAYYKQGVSGDSLKMNSDPDVKDAFKFNAWMQLKGMPQDEAKKEYIKLAHSILNSIKK